MHLSKDLWFVNQVSPTMMKIRWEKLNPRPIGASRPTLEAYWAKEKAARAEHRKIFDEGRAKLKAAGIKIRSDFPLSQEKQARAHAKEITKKTGVEMEVAQGCYLAL